MSRFSTGADQILVKPTNNVYTVLVAIGIVAEVVSFIYVYMMHKQLTGLDLFGNG